MGRDWLYWIGGGGGGGGGSGRSSTRKGKVSGELMGDAAATSAGCMCAVFQLFDLHHFHQFPLNQQHPSDFPPDSPSLQEDVTTSKGVEAPRNSLELEQPSAMDAASMSLAMKDEQNLNFPVGIQIKTSKTMVSSPRVCTSASRSRTDDFSSECSSNSPGAKTPSLVARLMGLDVLPECSSPSFSCSNSRPHLHRNPPKKERNLLQNRSSRNFSDDDISVGARSLPETPRISSARRSDVEYHRLSLQINKENIIEESAHSDKMVGRRGRFSRVQLQDENRSPGHYAKQIVKQVKESVSRRVGLDITNTGRNREQISTRRDENLILLKPTKKNSKILSRFEEEISPDGKQSVTASCSPRLRFLDPNKNKPLITNSGTSSPRISSSSDTHQHAQGITKPKPQPIFPLQDQQQQQKDSKKVGGNNGKCSSSHLKKLPPQASDYAIRNKKEEPFVRSPATSLADKKSKKTPLSTDILNILQVKKDPSSSLKLPQKQPQVSDALSSKRSTQLSSKTSHSYKQLQLNPDKYSVSQKTSYQTALTVAPPLPRRHRGGVRKLRPKILNLAGIINNVSTPSTLVKCTLLHIDLPSSRTLPPSTTTSATGGGCSTILSRRCNRKLIFQLVNELLAEILKPHFSLRPLVPPITRVEHSPLVDELCKKIDSFPASNCQVLEDIDSLIDKDLRKSHLNGFSEEESENLVREIETEILESLVRETVAMVGGRTADERTETDRCHVGASRDLMPLVGF
ncbi:UNVERIFIED_CONTAM: hypothetical protein Slati_4111900 [Sesamum latifolium]|uniref:DUF4378 domain-containing protein n=1 Tax=Sesamum latifolium TaxID=2727402 RepID=A0AAW2T7Y6_9LAMI